MPNTIKLDSSAMDELNFDDLLGDKLFDGIDMDLDDELPPEMKEMGDMCVESLPTSVTLAAEEKIAASIATQQAQEEEEAGTSSTKKKKKKKGGKKKGSKKKKNDSVSANSSGGGTLDKDSLDSIQRLHAMRSTPSTSSPPPDNKLSSSSSPVTSNNDTTKTKLSSKHKHKDNNHNHNPLLSSSSSSIIDKQQRKSSKTAASNPSSSNINTISSNDMTNTTPTTTPLWSIFPYKNMPSELSLKRMSSRLCPNLDILYSTTLQHQISNNNYNKNTNNKDNQSDNMSITSNNSKTKSKHKDKDNNNRIFTKQIVNGLRTYVTPKTSKSKPNNILQGILPELSSTIHLLNKQYNFMMNILHKLNTINKQYKITLKIGNDKYLYDHQSNNTNVLGGFITGNNALINPSFLIATMPTNYTFSSSTTSKNNSAINKNNRKRKNKNQSITKTQQHTLTNDNTNAIITPYHQRQKNISTHISNKAQILYEKYSKIRSKRKLHHTNKIADLEEIALLDEEVSLPPSPSLSRVSSEQSDLNYKQDKKKDKNDTILSDTLAMHAWIDTAGYLDDEYTMKDVKEELSDLWQPIWKTDDLEYLYGPVCLDNTNAITDTTLSSTLDYNGNIKEEDDDEEEEKKDSGNNNDTSNNQNYSLMDRLQSLLVVEDDSDDDDDDNNTVSSSLRNNDYSLNNSNKRQKHNNCHYNDGCYSSRNNNNNDDEYVLDVSDLTIDERIYIQLRSINLTPKLSFSNDINTTKSTSIIPKPSSSMSKYNELNQHINTLSNKLSKLHSTNNKKLAWLQYASCRHLSLYQYKKQQQQIKISKCKNNTTTHQSSSSSLSPQKPKSRRSSNTSNSYISGGGNSNSYTKDGNYSSSNYKHNGKSGKRSDDAWIP